MVEGLDMTLAELIDKKKATKKTPTTNLPPPVPRSARRSTARHSASSQCPSRGFIHRSQYRTAPYTSPHHKEGLTTSKYSEMYRNRKQDVQAETKGEARLYVSNLHYEVSNNDIKVLFSDVGELKRYGIHYDRSGRSKGSAEVVFVRKSDAIAAMQRYNNSRLDGERMYIDLIGPESLSPRPPRPPRPPPPPMLPNVAHQQMLPPPIPPNVEHQQMPPVPPPVTNWQMVYAMPSNVVTHQPLTPPMPPTVPHWQMTPISQPVPLWQRGQGFGQGQTPGQRHGCVSAGGHLRAEMENHVKWKHGSRSQGSNQEQKPHGKRHGNVSAVDLDADLEKYLSKRNKNTA